MPTLTINQVALDRIMHCLDVSAQTFKQSAQDLRGSTGDESYEAHCKALATDFDRYAEEASNLCADIEAGDTLIELELNYHDHTTHHALANLPAKLRA